MVETNNNYQQKIVLLQNPDGTVTSPLPNHGWDKCYKWATGENGKKYKTEEQQRNESGEFLWRRLMLLNQMVYGVTEPKIVEVRMWSLIKPTEETFTVNWEDVK